MVQGWQRPEPHEADCGQQVRRGAIWYFPRPPPQYTLSTSPVIFLVTTATIYTRHPPTNLGAVASG